MSVEFTEPIAYAAPQIAPGMPGANRTTVVQLALLFLIIVIAGAVRFHNLVQQSLFFDELWNVELATGRGSMHFELEPGRLYPADAAPRVTSLTDAPPAWTLWSNMRGVTHPPLYTILLRGWCTIFGTGDYATRSLSAVLSTLAVLVFFDAVRVMSGTTPALWAAAIMALAGPQIQLAQDVRPYALLILLGMAAIDVTARIERDGLTSRRAAALAACVFAMLLTHYFSVVAIAAVGLYVLIRTRGRTRTAVIAAFVIAGVVFAITWLPFMLRQSATLAESGDAWTRTNEDHHALHTLQRLALLPMRLMFEPLERSYVKAYVAAAVFVIPPMLFRRRPETLLWWLWLCATSFAIAALELLRTTHQLDELRYTILAGAGVYALLPLLAGALPPRPRWLHHSLPAAAVLGCVVALPQAYLVWKPDYREIAQFIDARYRPGDAVVFSTSYDSTLFGSAMFMGVSHYARTYPWPFMILRGEPTPEQVQTLRSSPGVWLVSPGALGPNSLAPGGRITDSKSLAPVAMIDRIEPAKTPTTRPTTGEAAR
jgi:uncharacterized membrane protein